MSLILLEKQGEAWRSRVEGHFILGVHPIETLRKGLPEAMAQAVIDHCAMAGEDVAVFAIRLAAEIEALKPAIDAVRLPTDGMVVSANLDAPFSPRALSVDRAYEWQIAVGNPAPRATIKFAPVEGRDAVEYINSAEIGNRQSVRVEPRRKRGRPIVVPVAPEAEQAPAEPVAAPKEGI